MPAHPFRHAYIGLGLLEDASIRHHGDTWSAEYLDAAGDPYLVVNLSPIQVRIEEFDIGKRVALTVDSTLLGAIGRHGQDALGGEMSRFWARVARSSSEVWIQLTPPEVLAAYVPAVGIGRVSVPVPLDGTWRDPEPGPLARRLGFRPFVEDAREVPATMFRYVEREARPRRERVTLRQTSLPGLLLEEAIAAYYAVNGRLRSIEWRPFTIPEPAERIGRAWKATIPALTPDGGIQMGYAILEDETPATATLDSAPVD
jgi:hypothetical protein